MSRSCRCQDPAVFGHEQRCPAGGWEAHNHSYMDCDCDACMDRRYAAGFIQASHRTAYADVAPL